MSNLLEPAQLVALLSGVFAASLLQGFTGFGFAIVAVPLISLFMPPAEALTYVMILQALIGLVGLPGAVKHCRWGLLGWLSLGVVLGTPLGLWAITTLPPALGRLAVGLAVLIALTLILLGGRINGRPTVLVTTLAGVAGGIMNGLAGMSGPPAVTLLVAAEVAPLEARSTLLIFVLGAAAAALVPLALAGRVTMGMGIPLLAAVPALLAGWGLGSKLFHRARPGQHRAVALAAMGGLAVITIGRSVVDLLGA